MRVMRKYTHITRIENCRYKNPHTTRVVRIGILNDVMMSEVSEWWQTILGELLLLKNAFLTCIRFLS